MIPVTAMRNLPDLRVNRRDFIRSTGAAAAIGLSRAATNRVSLVIDASDSVAGAAPAIWAAKELEQALAAKGAPVGRYGQLSEAPAGTLCVVIAGSRSAAAVKLLQQSKTAVMATPEALGLLQGNLEGKKVLLACGHDVQGLVYALLELSDRVQNSAEPTAALSIPKPITEQPANKIRSTMRMFTSDVEDKPWYNDREMWPRYLTELATQRFNQFHLAFGIGYDFIRQVTDAYFLFTYPFLISVPGYNVRVPQLPDSERDHNLEMLKYISEQTVARGMRFQLGLWMHGYQWIDSPNPNYTIEGLNSSNHGPYCRDAVRMLLKACPAVSGVTFRVHGESGVAEGDFDFWRTVFDGVASCGREIVIDMHPKGTDQTMLDVAAATKQPYCVSPKFWAEHLGMAYHQADIRELEQPKPDKQGSGLMKLSSGARSFLRYGYGDLLREDRTWKVVHRVWPGTQRLLLWGDPVTAAGYSRAFSFCGSDGVDLMEPLGFKGRRGSGIAGDRCAYLDASLRTRWDWEKYLYGTRVWGRLLYNPDTDPDVWRRSMRTSFGAGAPDAEEALANASRILPIITTAHDTSAGNNNYWPEIYTNQSMIDAAHPGPYTDTPKPPVFGNVSPLDPQLFSRINDFADELLAGERNGKYSPVEVAQWIEDYADAAMKHLSGANAKARNRNSPEYRRFRIDVAIQASTGTFFGAKFRSGVLYRIFEKTGDPAALEGAVAQYKKARAAWADIVEISKSIYMSDITVGEHPWLRGSWGDRLPAIDKDVAALESHKSQDTAVANSNGAAVIREVLGRPRRPEIACSHQPPEGFGVGTPMAIELSPAKAVRSVRLYYRHVNQAERFKTIDMEASGHHYSATIPADYTASEYPLEYYFELRQSPDQAWLYPGFAKDLTNQPYFVVRKAAGARS